MGSMPHTYSTSSDVAVIGLSCRFPGGASNSTKFWNLLHNRQSAYSEVPKSRFNRDAFYHPGDKQGTLRCRGGHFLAEDVSSFDAPFFNITAQEAKAMDPTARMLLEVTYEALENAGLPIQDLTGSDTSCYVGCFTRDWHEQQIKDSETAPMYAGTGTGFSLLSNRVSWFYDLRGPSLTLDTACSSSLVGLHLAVQGLRSGESKLAIVSGANLILSPDLAIFLSNLHMLSKEGLSRSFADGTTGYGRGEGIATIILKPLTDALRDGDSIRAVIRGTGVNQDGHTTGITVPNSDAQADLIISTYRSAGLDLAQTAYFEAHGTGTAVGDPLELGAVARTLGAVRSKTKKPLLVGSVKSNIGHLEGAAGLAGVIKCILMLESGTILPNIHFDRPNRRIPFDKWNITVPTSVSPWPAELLRRASVNSFGYGGTNAHAILDSAAEYLQSIGWDPSRTELASPNTDFQRPRLFVVSAHDEPALGRLQNQFLDYLASIEPTTEGKSRESEAHYLDRLCYTLSERRTRFDWKAYVVASTVEELKHQLSSSSISTTRSGPTRSKIAFIFTGQGAQWAAMGLELVRFPVFRDSLAEAEQYLKSEVGSEWSVLEELGRHHSESKIQLAKFSQPLCTILQVALVDLLVSWGIKPDGVVGHSSGEIGAAYAYGAISREDAWSISFWRGKICSELVNQAPELKGSMAAVGLSKEDALPYVSSTTQGKVVIACVNSPSSVTISGDEAAIDELELRFKTASVFCRKLKVENAYHSHHMQRIAVHYLQKISNMNPLSGTTGVVMASSVTGRLVQSSSELGPEYWVKNLVSPVLFSDAVKTLFTSSATKRRRAKTAAALFNSAIELGPHAALKGPLRQILQGEDIKDVNYTPVVVRGEDATNTALRAAGLLYAQGVPVSLCAVNQLQTRSQPMIDLPPYPWNHSLKYWSEPRISRNYRNRKFPYHDLLGTLTLGHNELEPSWRNHLRTSEKPWLRDHVVHSAVLYPAAGILAMPIEAMRQIANQERKIDAIQLKEVNIGKAIVVPDDQVGIETILQLRREKSASKDDSMWWRFTVFSSLEDQAPEENGSGLITIIYKSTDADAWLGNKTHTNMLSEQAYRSSFMTCQHQISPRVFYETTQQAGLEYGPTFQGLTEISTGDYRAACVVSIPDTRATMPEGVESEHLIHPTTLDIIFHSLFAALGRDGELNFETAAVPISFESLTVSSSLPSGAGSEFRGFCTAKRETAREILADIFYSDNDWNEPKVQIKGIRCRELPRSSANHSAELLKAPLGTFEWKPDLHLLRGLSWTGNSPLHKILDASGHKKPDLSILILGGDATLAKTTISILSGDHEISRFSRLVVANADSGSIRGAQHSLQEYKSKVSFVRIDESVGLDVQDLVPNSFDVILAAPEFVGFSRDTRLANDIERLLTFGGVSLAFKTTKDELVSWNKAIAQTDLTLIGASPPTTEVLDVSPVTISTAVKSYEADTADALGPIYILTTSNQSSEALALSEEIGQCLLKKDIQVKKVSWPPQPSKLIGKPIISLLELEDSFLAGIAESDFDLLKNVVLRSGSLTWVCAGSDPAVGAAVGYLRVLKNENPNLNLRYLWTGAQNIGSKLNTIADSVAKVVTTANIDREFSLIDDEICISRLIPNQKVTQLTEDTLSTTETATLGALSDALKIVPSTSKSPAHLAISTGGVSQLSAGEVEVDVKSLFLSASSGSEASAKQFSGIVTAVGPGCSLHAGDTVYGCSIGPYCTRYRLPEALCHSIPDQELLQVSSMLAITFSSAHQGLVRVAKIKEGQRVLIQDASSGIGIAAIQIAQALNAVVHVTVKTEGEAKLVQTLGVQESAIFHDQDPALPLAVLTSTGGEGYDSIIITSSNAYILAQLWKCLSSSGSLVKLGGAALTGSLEMEPFQKGCTFSQINLEKVLEDNPLEVSDALKELSSFLKTCKLSPVSFARVFPADDISDAFQHINAQGSQGEAIVTFDSRNRVPISPSVKNPLKLRNDATYILTGGLGGLGRSLARLLAAHGARHLVFISRSGLRSANAQNLVEELTTLGVSANVHACDISDESAMTSLLKRCSEQLPPIKGVIQSAAVLNDAVYDNMTHGLWQEAIRPKVQGSWLLHKLLPKDMDFFVMLSSIAGVVGNRSQASYATGNTFQDTLAKYRREEGLAAVAVDLGLMLDIGLIAERGGFTNLRKSEAVGLNEKDFHEIMKAAMVGSYGDTIVPPQLVTGLPSGGILYRQGLDAPFYYDDPRFSLLKKMGLEQAIHDLGGEDGPGGSEKSLATELGQCKTQGEAATLITAALCELLAKGLQTSAANIDSNKPLHSYGVDSLMAVEIRTWILQKAKADITLFDVLSGSSIAALALKVATSSKLVNVTS